MNRRTWRAEVLNEKQLRLARDPSTEPDMLVDLFNDYIGEEQFSKADGEILNPEIIVAYEVLANPNLSPRQWVRSMAPRMHPPDERAIYGFANTSLLLWEFSGQMDSMQEDFGEAHIDLINQMVRQAMANEGTSYDGSLDNVIERAEAFYESLRSRCADLDWDKPDFSEEDEKTEKELQRFVRIFLHASDKAERDTGIERASRLAQFEVEAIVSWAIESQDFEPDLSLPLREAVASHIPVTDTKEWTRRLEEFRDRSRVDNRMDASWRKMMLLTLFFSNRKDVFTNVLPYLARDFFLYFPQIPYIDLIREQMR